MARQRSPPYGGCRDIAARGQATRRRAKPLLGAIAHVPAQSARRSPERSAPFASGNRVCDVAIVLAATLTSPRFATWPQEPVRPAHQNDGETGTHQAGRATPGAKRHDHVAAEPYRCSRGRHVGEHIAAGGTVPKRLDLAEAQNNGRPENRQPETYQQPRTQPMAPQ